MKCSHCGKNMVGKYLVLDNEVYCNNCVKEEKIYTFPDGWRCTDNEVKEFNDKATLRKFILNHIERLKSIMEECGEEIDISDLLCFLKEIDEEE